MWVSMKFGVPWSVKGIRPEARETAKEAARRSGMSLGDWLNSVILQQAEEDGVRSPPLAYDDDDDGDELSTVHQRLDDLTRRIEQFTRTGPAAYAPKRSRNDGDQIAGLIARLDQRLDQFVNTSRAMPQAAPAMPTLPMPPALDRAIAEITARQRALNGQPAPARARPQAPAAAPMPAPQPAPMLAPAPTQDLSGLEDQLRKITNQIETLRRPGVEEAINALRAELGEIGRALNDAMPRRAIDTIEKQIAGLTQRIAEGRQAGVDGGALSGVEHGLAEVRDALRGLTPAENLIGFQDAVAALAHKIDLIVAQQDPATLHQLEHAITTLRDMAGHVASNDAVSGLATQVQMLGEKVEHISMSGGASDALNNLEQRISALADALEQRAQNGGTVPPMLEALVQSLSDKIELIQQSRGDNVAAGHLEDQIVALVQRLDASDSRLGHLEAIERGLADLLVHIEDMRANKGAGGLRGENSPGVDALKHDIARTQDALEAVNGTLGHVVDRLVMIEKGFRGEGRARPVSDSEFAEIKQPIGKVVARMVSETPPAAAPPRAPAPIPAPAPPVAAAPPAPPPPAAAPKRLPPAGRLPINPDLPPDQPLEPGSGPPPLRANPAARIAASEAALGGARPAAEGAPVGKSGFIAAARRAAQAAVQAPRERAPQPEPIEMDDGEAATSLRSKMMKRVKSLFIAASIVAVVVGSIQIAGNFLDFGNSAAPNVKTAKAPATDTGASDTPALSEKAEAPATLAANPLELPKLPMIAPLAPPTGSNVIATTPALDYNPVPQGLPSLLSPPLLDAKSDTTGSISRSAGNARPPRPPAPPQQPAQTGLPISIGGVQLRNAAMAGDAAAAYEVAARFAEGRGVPVSLEDAARWYERAANKGLAPAQFRYASMLEKGQGVKKDLAQARRLYLAAAAQGNGKAMHNLAVLYAEGIEGKPDYGTAALWFSKAAQRGIADSQYNLAVLCARGLGTEKSIGDAYKWFALAAAQGDREAAKKRDDVASHLDAEALAAAQRAVKNFAAEPQPEGATAVAEPPGGWDRATAAPPHVKSRSAEPMSLSAFQVGKR
jgi:localization factor PodJL